MPFQWLGTAVREHGRYLLLSVALFVVGVALGAALVARGVDLLAGLGLDNLSRVFPAEPTVAFILLNNTRAFVVFLLGAFTLGLLTVLGLVVNRVLLGYVGALAAGNRGIGYVLLAIAPHSVLELPALFAASAVAFRVVARVGARVVGGRSTVMTGDEWRRTAGLVVTAWFLLAVAAFVEIHVTFTLVEALYG
jgi:stage II sporulation protein M